MLCFVALIEYFLTFLLWMSMIIKSYIKVYARHLNEYISVGSLSSSWALFLNICNLYAVQSRRNPSETSRSSALLQNYSSTARKKEMGRQTEEFFSDSFGRKSLPGHLSPSMPAVRLRWGVSQTLHASSSTLAAVGTSSSCEGRSGENQMGTFLPGVMAGRGGEGWVAVGFFFVFPLFWVWGLREAVPVDSERHLVLPSSCS